MLLFNFQEQNLISYNLFNYILKDPFDYEYIDTAYNYEYDDDAKLRPIFYNRTISRSTPSPKSIDETSEYFDDYPTDDEYSDDYTYYYEDEADLKTFKQNKYTIKIETSTKSLRTEIAVKEESYLNKIRKFLRAYYFTKNISIAMKASYLVIAASVSFVFLSINLCVIS